MRSIFSILIANSLHIWCNNTNTKNRSIFNKKFLVVLMTATIALSSTILSLTGEWRQTGQGWWYDNGNCNYRINSWQKSDNKWYYFNQDGYMRTGWFSINDKWYYCNSNGEMAHDIWNDGKHYVGSEGSMYVNTITPDEKK